MFDAEISTVIKARRPTPARSDRCNGYPRNRTVPACVRRRDRSRRSASATCVARASLRGREFGRWSKSREDWRRGTRSSSACTNRDLPMPGSPEIGTTWHSPVWTRRQRRARMSICSSRPTSSVSPATRRASSQLSEASAAIESVPCHLRVGGEILFLGECYVHRTPKSKPRHD
jgi:hypothetical protein